MDLKLEISRKVGSNRASFDVAATGSDMPAAYLWEVQDGIPVLADTERADFTFELLKPATKYFQLSAYTKNGCRVMSRGSIVLENIRVPKSRKTKKPGVKKIPKKRGSR